MVSDAMMMKDDSGDGDAKSFNKSTAYCNINCVHVLPLLIVNLGTVPRTADGTTTFLLVDSRVGMTGASVVTEYADHTLQYT